MALLHASLMQLAIALRIPETDNASFLQNLVESADLLRATPITLTAVSHHSVCQAVSALDQPE